ncbi:MAG: hypothetical protein IAE85_05185 [Anaerolinea sp.]|nr:hypothetical protein [Anaerolinea sp.]
MGLITRARRLHYVWSWRLRYWWLDTPAGAQAQMGVLAFAALVVIIQLIRMAMVALVPPSPGEPAKAIYWWVVQLIIAIVSAIISYAMRPKVEEQKPQAGKAPSTQDGQAVKDHFGTVWVEDEFILAWKMMGTDRIRSKGGKK